MYELEVEQLKLDEGLSLTPYECTASMMTIGYGRNIESNGISEEEADFMLKNDYERSIKDAASLIGAEWNQLNEVRQGALINMAFNLGKTRMGQFRRMIAAVKAFDFEQAAIEMLNSRWSAQVGQRSNRLADRMRAGI